MSTGIVVVAGGSGTRLGAAVPKAFVLLEGRSLLARSVAAAVALPGLAELVVVVPQGYADRALLPDGLPAGLRVRVVAGGAERTDSVAAGLAELGGGVDVVLVHDAARALAPVALFARVEAAVRAGCDAVVPGVPVTDTIKAVDADGHVVQTPDRAALRAVQTPQGFRRPALVRALARGESATDEAALVERDGGTVRVIPGDALAMKVTTGLDLVVAAYLLHHPPGGRIPKEAEPT